MEEVFNINQSQIRVSKQGAKIKVSLGGVLILGSFTRGDGKEGITHPCTPIFGPDRKNLYGLKQHGTMRNETQEIVNVKNGFQIKHTIMDLGYPSGMHVEQRLKLENDIFKFQMSHINNGDKEAAVNSGEHCYFDAPEGFEGTKINGQNITDLIKNNFDGIAINLYETNTIQIPGKPAYTLEQNGFKKTVVWVGKNPETKEIDKTYVCIEPVENDPFNDFFGSRPSFIQPGQSRTTQFQIALL